MRTIASTLLFVVLAFGAGPILDITGLPFWANFTAFVAILLAGEIALTKYFGRP